MLVWLLFAGCDNGDYDGDGFSEPYDCDDGDIGTYPGAPEVPYDGKDQDCNGTDLDDQDRDGFQGELAGGADCDDFDPDKNPAAEDKPYDGIDQDCDRWSDNDFDHDGYDAMGHGGDDCDDNNPLVTPIDLDGDGFSPCTGDCDETDPRRNELATPICGNGLDDDCDGVSDCATVGVVIGGALSDRIIGSEAVSGFGSHLLGPGDIDGDGIVDVLVSGSAGDMGHVWLFSTPVNSGSDETASWGVLTAPFIDGITSPGDVDGDGRPDIAIDGLDAQSQPHLWVLAGIVPGLLDVPTVARLDVIGQNGDDVGSAVARTGEWLAIGAAGRDEVQLLPLAATGHQLFGAQGAVLRGAPNSNAGGALLSHDTDGDGDPELFIAASGTVLGARPTVSRLSDLPATGTHDIADFAVGTLDARIWGQSSTVFAAGDLDDDGRDDLAVAAPLANGAVGAVAILFEPLSDEVFVDDVETQRLGLGDDTFGWSLLAQDLDGDGFDDLIVGAPAAWGVVGGAYKPGAVHVWYGPIDALVEHSFTNDLLVEGTLGDRRSAMGYALALADFDGDGGSDLLISSPQFEQGQVEALPAGLTGLYGF